MLKWLCLNAKLKVICAECPNVLCRQRVPSFTCGNVCSGGGRGSGITKAIVRANGVKYLTPKQYHSATQMHVIYDVASFSRTVARERQVPTSPEHCLSHA